MKIVFLDIDGVLNTRRNCLAQDGRARPFDAAAVTALNRILKETGAQIVVSSTWRIKPKTWTSERIISWLDELLMLEGLPIGVVVGYTPLLEYEQCSDDDAARPRRDEIRAWLDAHPQTSTWIVIDDDPGAGPENLILCGEDDGLTEAHATNAIALLGSNHKA